MKNLPNEEKIDITNKLNTIINIFNTELSTINPTKEKLEQIYEENKNELKFLCEKYQDVNLPEIDALEFHETYSQEYKDSRKEEYLDLDQIDRQLYKAYVMASNYEYYMLEMMDKLSNQDVKE